MTAALVVLPAADVERLVSDAVRRALAEHDRRSGSTWVDADAAAELLGIDRRTVMRKASGGKLPGKKCGRAWRFRREDIDAFIASR